MGGDGALRVRDQRVKEVKRRMQFKGTGPLVRR